MKLYTFEYHVSKRTAFELQQKTLLWVWEVISAVMKHPVQYNTIEQSNHETRTTYALELDPSIIMETNVWKPTSLSINIYYPQR